MPHARLHAGYSGHAGYWVGLALLLIAAVAGPTPAAVSAETPRPARVVSMNVCTDQLAVQLLERGRIASISFLGADPRYSAVADKVGDIPLNHGHAEEVLRHDPDLVLAGTYTSRATVALLRRLGYDVVEVAPPRDIPAVRAQIRTVADALGVPERGEALVSELNAGLRAAAPPKSRDSAPTAAIYEANGIAIGPGELAHAVLEAAGFRNLGEKLGLRGPSPLPLEKLIVERPDVLILQMKEDPPPSQASNLLRHPALEALREHVRMTVIPRPLWSCGGPQLGRALALLAEARRELR